MLDVEITPTYADMLRAAAIKQPKLTFFLVKNDEQAVQTNTLYMSWEDGTIKKVGDSDSTGIFKVGSFAVSEKSGTALTNYQVKVPVKWKQGLKSNFSNLRMIDTDGTILNHWIVPDSIVSGVSCNVWVKFPSLSANELRACMYGYATTENPGNGNNVFDFFDDFESGSFDNAKWAPYSTTDKTYAFVDNWRMEPLFNTLGTQGMVADGTYFYLGKDNGVNIASTIYKYDYAGNLITSFAGPAHCNSLSLRAAKGTIIACTSGDPTSKVIQEIDKTTGTLIKEWQFGGLNNTLGPNACYFGEGSDGVSFRVLVKYLEKLYKVLLHPDGSYEVEKMYTQDSSVTIARQQALSYINGLVYCIGDDNTGVTLSTTNYGRVVAYRLDDANSAMTFVNQWQHLPGIEREGITFDGTNWYYNAVGQVYKLEIADSKSAIFNSIGATGLASGMMSVPNFPAPSIVFGRLWMDGTYPTFALADASSSAQNLIGVGRFDTTTGGLKMKSIGSGTANTSNLIAATADYLHWHNYELKWQTSKFEVFLDNATLGNMTTALPTANLSIRIDGHTNSAPTAFHIGAEYVGVRKFASVEPAVSVS